MKEKIVLDAPDSFMERFLKGDPECLHSVGSKIYKSAGDEEDHHKIGEKGIVTGSYRVPEDLKHEISEQDMYLVTFTGDTDPTLIMGSKIRADDQI